MAGLPVTFERKCSTAAEFAERYRVLAAMSPDGVTFTQSPENLRAMARVFDLLDQKPAVLLVEVERPLSNATVVWFTLSLGLTAFGLVGDAALALLRWIGVVA
jgi:hypothetical protein